MLGRGSLKFCLTLVVLNVLCPTTKQAWGKYGGGSGTAEDPYLIVTAEDMNAIGTDANDWDKHFKLMSDIDLSAYTGTAFNIIGVSGDPFRGTFDGNGYKIFNFSYYEPGGRNIALFGRFNGTLKNLGLISPDVDAATSTYDLIKGSNIGALIGLGGGNISGCFIEGGSVSGNSSVGGLAGDFYGGTISDCYSTCSVSSFENIGGLVGLHEPEGIISNCYFAGSVSGKKGGIGGLVGQSHGIISDSYSTGSVTGIPSGDYEGNGGLVGVNGDDGVISYCYSEADVSGRYLVGGLVGVNWGQISDCYATGNAYGIMWIGGLGGGNAGYIYRCYSTGNASGSSWVGGLVGGSEGGIIIGSFWDRQTSGNSWSVGGTGKTTSQMQTKSTFTSAGWDFTTPIWTIEDNDYPRLWWEKNILYVPGHYPTIQAAIDAAVDGDTVLVAPGTYTGEGNRDIDFKGKAITVRSTDPNNPDVVENTVIDCQGTEEEPHRGFYFNNGEDANSILNGFSIKNGKVNGYGGGIYFSNCNPRVKNCIFEDNWTSWDGAGVGVYNLAHPTLVNCIFRNNIAAGQGSSFGCGGGLSTFSTDPTLINCVFIGNSANKGGGMENHNGSCPKLVNCTFIGNTANIDGGGIKNHNGYPELTNCTLVKNLAPEGGGIKDFYSNSRVLNCILWGNRDNGGTGQSAQISKNSGVPSVDYCCIQGWTGIWGGFGNIGDDPLFVGSEVNDFHLLPDSPCIDAGDPCSPWELEPWPNGARVNMGAYGNTPEATRSRDGLQFAGLNIIEKTRTDRTIFRYVLSLSLTNITEDDMTEVYVKLIDASSQVTNVIDDEIFYPLIEANSTVDSSTIEDYFIIDVDRSELITPGRLTWQVDYTRTDSSQMQMMSAVVPIEAVGDISGDGKVDFEDLWRLADKWLWTGQAGEIAEDIFADGIVDFKDLAEIAGGW